jgi:hypothetical protein
MHEHAHIFVINFFKFYIIELLYNALWRKDNLVKSIAVTGSCSSAETDGETMAEAGRVWWLRNQRSKGGLSDLAMGSGTTQ